MWRQLAVMLFVLVVAHTASALPISEVLTVENSTHLTNTQIEQQPTSVFDDNEPEDLLNLPRLNRISPTLFNAEIQTTPNYVLVIEFFEIKLTAGLFKNLANPPAQLNWFEQLSHKSHSNRLSGWKDSNTLYTARAIYHS